MGSLSFLKTGWGFVPEELKQIPKISVSGLMEFNQSPSHYESTYLLKEREETQAMQLGSAIHMTILEPSRFDSSYFLEPEDIPENVFKLADPMKEMLKTMKLPVSGTKKELCEKLNANGFECFLYEDWLLKQTNGRDILKLEDWRACQRIKRRIMNSNFKALIQNGTPEQLGWGLHSSGLMITFKADYFKPVKFEEYQALCIDLKKVPDVSKRSFERLIYQRGLHIQAGLYSALITSLTGLKTGFGWLAVESKAPSPVACYITDSGTIDAGEQHADMLIKKFKACNDLNYWPTGYEEFTQLALPHWAWDDIEKQLTEEEKNDGTI